MYRVTEYYQTGSRLKPIKAHREFDDFEEAKTFAEALYAELAKVPESEQVRVCVVENDQTVPLVLPDGKAGRAKT